MTDDDAKPAPAYHTDRASARTADEREAHWLHWWARRGQPYEAAVTEAGGTPWTTDVDERRELFMRRYRHSKQPTI